MTTTDSSPVSRLILQEDGPPVSAEGSLDAHALLVTPVEAARRLSVGRTTIYALMASGELSSVTIGRCRRVPVTSLQSFVDRLVDNASVEGRQWLCASEQASCRVSHVVAGGRSALRPK